MDILQLCGLWLSTVPNVVVLPTTQWTIVDSGFYSPGSVQSSLYSPGSIQSSVYSPGSVESGSL